MLKFKSMRQRVEFAYEQMNVDIYYEGEYRYTVENHKNDQLFEMVSEVQVDQILNKIWQELHITQKVG